MAKGSKLFQSFGRTHSDLFLQPKFLPGWNELRLKLHRADLGFSLIANTEAKYTVSIEKAVYKVKHYDIAPHILEAHAKAIRNDTIKYPVKHVEMKYFPKGASRSDLSE